MLGQECSFFALTIGFVAVRMFKLLVISLFYAARLDQELLADGVGEIKEGVKFDRTFSVFLTDLLQREAHHHPFIESLGTMYLMKVLHGPNFATPAGCCWRLLYTAALLPWLKEYRVAARSDENSSNSGRGRSDKLVPTSETSTMKDVDLTALREENDVLRRRLSQLGEIPSKQLPGDRGPLDSE